MRCFLSTAGPPTCVDLVSIVQFFSILLIAIFNSRIIVTSQEFQVCAECYQSK